MDSEGFNQEIRENKIVWQGLIHTAFEIYFDYYGVRSTEPLSLFGNPCNATQSSSSIAGLDMEYTGTTIHNIAHIAQPGVGNLYPE